MHSPEAGKAVKLCNDHTHLDSAAGIPSRYMIPHPLIVSPASAGRQYSVHFTSGCNHYIHGIYKWYLYVAYIYIYIYKTFLFGSYE